MAFLKLLSDFNRDKGFKKFCKIILIRVVLYCDDKVNIKFLDKVRIKSYLSSKGVDNESVTGINSLHFILQIMAAKERINR